MPKQAPAPTAAAQVAAAVPNYEVKLFLDHAQVLDAEFRPTREADRALDLKGSNLRIAMLFLDARPPALQPGGWAVRVRRFEGSDGLELSDKRRYPFEPGRLADDWPSPRPTGSTPPRATTPPRSSGASGRRPWASPARRSSRPGGRAGSTSRPSGSWPRWRPA
ncbi:MAG: hypothetical protein K2X87_03965, partial [Gemmataceae bacterium]|nr:hypothetical protein [Gemmataceae bacterium]